MPRRSYTQSTRKELELHFRRWRIESLLTTICIEGDMHQKIAAGIGRLTTVKPDMKDKNFAYLCEPLVVLYLSSIFAQRPETTNLPWVSDATFIARNSLSVGFVSEEAVLMILLQMFGGEPRLMLYTLTSPGSREG